MHRRTVLKSSLAALAFARTGWAQDDEGWRTFEVVTRVDIVEASGVTRAWLPLPSAAYGEYQRVLTQRWRGSSPILRAERDTPAAMLYAEWPAGHETREVELTFRVAVRDRSADWSTRTSRSTPQRTLNKYLSGVAADIRAEARRIAAGESDAVSKARAIYEWVVDHHPARVRGTSFVRFARAAGVPARTVSGLHIPAGSGATAPYERAEFHSPMHGWVPVDPAAASDPYRRRQMFGSWKPDWVALNEASMMHPRAEAGGRPLDSATAAFRHTTTARDLS
jgi:transglutaminase-like putative cysteine protease